MLWCAVRSAEVQCGGMLVARELGFLGWLCAAAVHVRFWGSLSALPSSVDPSALALALEEKDFN